MHKTDVALIDTFFVSKEVFFFYIVIHKKVIFYIIKKTLVISFIFFSYLNKESFT